MFELDDIVGGIGELDLFDNIGFVSVFKLAIITKGIEECDFFVKIWLVCVFEPDNMTEELKNLIASNKKLWLLPISGEMAPMDGHWRPYVGAPS